MNEIMEKWYLLWDLERQMWWRPGSAGYTRDRTEAGVYARATAVEIILGAANAGRVREAVALVRAHEGDLEYAHEHGRITP